MADDPRRQMADALTLLEKRLLEWQTEGQELQAQLVRLTMAVFIDDRPLTDKEQAWAASLVEGR